MMGLRYQYRIAPSNRKQLELLKGHLQYSIEMLAHNEEIKARLSSAGNVQAVGIIFEMMARLQRHIGTLKDRIFILSDHSFRLLTDIESERRPRHHLPDFPHKDDEVIWISFIYVLYNNSLSKTILAIKDLNDAQDLIALNQIKKDIEKTIFNLNEMRT